MEDSSEEGCCWVCQGVIEDPGDLFYPCNCKLHKKCIKEWVAKVSGVGRSVGEGGKGRWRGREGRVELNALSLEKREIKQSNKREGRNYIEEEG